MHRNVSVFHLSVDGHLDPFQLFAAVNGAAVNMNAQVLVWVPVVILWVYT